MLEKLRREINFPILIILLGAIFVRIYNVGRILEFYFDQGRDALVIWQFLHQGKLFLVGPTTGIAGIFRGPWYYWLITPFYFLGQGNPVWPAIFLSLTTVVAIWLLAKIAMETHSFRAGLLAALLAAFSYHFVVDSRWLSNPTPMFLISMVLVWTLLRRYWFWVILMLGLAMQFGSAAEIFLFPAVFLIFLFEKQKPGPRQIFWGLIGFFILAAPQIAFDFRHQGVLSAAIKNFLLEKQSFQLSFWEVLGIRLPFFYQSFLSKIFPELGNWAEILGVTLLLTLILRWQKLNTRKVRILLVLLLAPLLGMLFFQGNYGNVYSYYFTGYYFIFILLVAIFLAEISQGKFGLLFLALFSLLFLGSNWMIIRDYLSCGRAATLFQEQKQALGWIYQDAQGESFNLDVYVPPVLPYEYEYLFLWYGQKEYGSQPEKEPVGLLYTLVEHDPPHPERINSWLARQAEIGEIIREAKFGGLTVQRRIRL